MKQADDAKKAALSLMLACKSLNDGQKIDESALPGDITPEYIWGISKLERSTNFTNVIRGYLQQKKDIDAKLANAKNGFSKLSKVQLNKKKNEITNVLEMLQNQGLYMKDIIDK